jgi:hypothetical protein
LHDIAAMIDEVDIIHSSFLKLILQYAKVAHKNNKQIQLNENQQEHVVTVDVCRDTFRFFKRFKS